MDNTSLDDEHLYARAQELMREFPSRSACAIRLKSEGFTPSRVDVIVAELFDLRKVVASKRLQDKEDMVKVLVQILDSGDTMSASDSPELHEAAAQYAVSLRKQISGDKFMIFLFPAIVITLAALVFIFPDVAWFASLMSVKYFGCFQVFILGLLSGPFWLFVSSCKSILRARDRANALRAMAERSGWVDISI